MPLRMPWLMQGAVRDDKGRSLIGFGFLQCLEGLLLVGAHGDLEATYT